METINPSCGGRGGNVPGGGGGRGGRALGRIDVGFCYTHSLYVTS